MTSHAFLRGELIGLRVKVPGTSIQGVIMDETKHTLTLSTRTGTRKVVKDYHDITFLLSGKEITVPGKDIAMRPEERIKLKRR